MKGFEVFPTNVLIGQFRNVFSSRNGQDVLSYLLYELGVFRRTPDTPEAVALRNHGLKLIEILGGNDNPDEGTIKQFTNKLMKQPLKKEVEND